MNFKAATEEHENLDTVKNCILCSEYICSAWIFQIFICTLQIYTFYFKTQLKTVILTVNKVQVNNWKLYFDCTLNVVVCKKCSRSSWCCEKLYFVHWKIVICTAKTVFYTVKKCIFCVVNIFLQCMNISKLSHVWPTFHVQNSIIHRCIFPHTSIIVA